MPSPTTLAHSASSSSRLALITLSLKKTRSSVGESRFMSRQPRRITRVAALVTEDGTPHGNAVDAPQMRNGIVAPGDAQDSFEGGHAPSTGGSREVETDATERTRTPDARGVSPVADALDARRASFFGRPAMREAVRSAEPILAVRSCASGGESGGPCDCSASGASTPGLTAPSPLGSQSDRDAIFSQDSGGYQGDTSQAGGSDRAAYRGTLEWAGSQAASLSPVTEAPPPCSPSVAAAVARRRLKLPLSSCNIAPIYTVSVSASEDSPPSTASLDRAVDGSRGPGRGQGERKLSAVEAGIASSGSISAVKRAQGRSALTGSLSKLVAHAVERTSESTSFLPVGVSLPQGGQRRKKQLVLALPQGAPRSLESGRGLSPWATTTTTSEEHDESRGPGGGAGWAQGGRHPMPGAAYRVAHAHILPGSGSPEPSPRSGGSHGSSSAGRTPFVRPRGTPHASHTAGASTTSGDTSAGWETGRPGLDTDISVGSCGGAFGGPPSTSTSSGSLDPPASARTTVPYPPPPLMVEHPPDESAYAAEDHWQLAASPVDEAIIATQHSMSTPGLQVGARARSGPGALALQRGHSGAGDAAAATAVHHVAVAFEDGPSALGAVDRALSPPFPRHKPAPGSFGQALGGQPSVRISVSPPGPASSRRISGASFTTTTAASRVQDTQWHRSNSCSAGDAGASFGVMAAATENHGPLLSSRPPAASSLPDASDQRRAPAASLMNWPTRALTSGDSTPAVSSKGKPVSRNRTVELPPLPAVRRASNASGADASTAAGGAGDAAPIGARSAQTSTAGSTTSQVHFSSRTLSRLRARGFHQHVAPGQPTPRLGLNCCFADDERANRRVNARLLDRLGCRVLLVEDGDEVEAALEAARGAGRPVDILLLDIVMRRLNGDVLCRALRARGVTMPIIAATGNASEIDREKYLESDGFDVVLAKPFSLHDLANALVAVRAAWGRSGSSSDSGAGSSEGEEDEDHERGVAATAYQ